MNLLITFRQRLGSPQYQSLGLIGLYNGENWRFIIKEGIKGGFRGCTADKLIYIVSSDSLYIYDDLLSKSAYIVSQKRWKNCHGIYKQGNEIKVVSTDEGVIYKVNLEDLNISKIGYYGVDIHLNSIHGNYVTALNKGQTSFVLDINDGSKLECSKWYRSHNYTPLENDGYIIVNGNGQVILNNNVIYEEEGKFLRGLLIKDNIAYVGVNVFRDMNKQKYAPPKIVAIDLKTSGVIKVIEIPVDDPWVIYDIVECDYATA